MLCSVTVGRTHAVERLLKQIAEAPEAFTGVRLPCALRAIADAIRDETPLRCLLPQTATPACVAPSGGHERADSPGTSGF
jgi:hypothetical protein